MLAPGEYLLKPPSEEAPAKLPAERTGEPTPPAPVVETEEAESRSFLMILLRALGAIHT